MISGYIDLFSEVRRGSDRKPSGDGISFCDVDLSDLPQLSIEDGLLNDLPCLEPETSPGSASSIWHSVGTCLREVDGSTDPERCKYEMSSPNGDEAVLLSNVALTSPVEEAPENAQLFNGSASTSCEVDGRARLKPQIDPSQKKQSRLLRNRELAHESRQRKKSLLKDLELKCTILEQERKELQRQIVRSYTENTVLKEEVSRLKRMKGNNGVAEPAVLIKDSLPLEFRLHHTCLSLLTFVSLLLNPFLALLLGTVYLLQSLKGGAGGLARGRVGTKAYLLEIWRKWGTSIAVTKEVFFSFWRRRRKCESFCAKLLMIYELGRSLVASNSPSVS